MTSTARSMHVATVGDRPAFADWCRTLVVSSTARERLVAEVERDGMEAMHGRSEAEANAIGLAFSRDNERATRLLSALDEAGGPIAIHVAEGVCGFVRRRTTKVGH